MCSHRSRSALQCTRVEQAGHAILRDGPSAATEGPHLLRFLGKMARLDKWHRKELTIELSWEMFRQGQLSEVSATEAHGSLGARAGTTVHARLASCRHAPDS